MNRTDAAALGAILCGLVTGILLLLRDAPSTLFASCLGVLACGVGIGYCLAVDR